MVIRYHCRHCETEIGSLPFESAEVVVKLIRKLENDTSQEDEEFLVMGEGGEMKVRCICEQCEESLQRFPNYYTLKKWLQ